MPILVQWKWQQKTKTFLVIFHFCDDFSKPNLRTRCMAFRGKGPFFMYVPEDMVLSNKRLSTKSQNVTTVVTWSPSHIETGLLSEILSYANVINGFTEETKRRLKVSPIFCDFTDWKELPDMDKFREQIGYKMHTIGFDEIDKETGRAKLSFCAELCPEYIDYVRGILKPYL